MIEKDFATKEELHRYIVDNKEKLNRMKKAAVKHTDAIDFIPVKLIDKSDEADKAEDSEGIETPEEGTLNVTVAINTTNIIDSHYDMHVKGIWNRSVFLNPKTMHLQEHQRTFDHIISDEAVPMVKTMSWKALGMPYEGKTQVLIFQSPVKEERNEFMYEQYKKGWVKQHSVGMRYVDYVWCINSEEKWAAEEKANWDKYYPMAVNPEVADEYGYFCAVLEAKFIEGSAVVFGSNSATPTLSVKGHNSATTLEAKGSEHVEDETESDEVKPDKVGHSRFILKKSFKLE